MEVRLLGPVEVADGDRAVTIAARKQRALLAALALQAGRVAPIDVSSTGSGRNLLRARRMRSRSTRTSAV